MLYQDFAVLDVAGAQQKMKSSEAGLSDAAAKSRLASAGGNSIPRPPFSGLAIFWRQVRSPMALVLVAAFAISLVVSDWQSGVTILAFLLLNTFFGFSQEYRSENVARKLEKFIAPTALVRRGGKWKRVVRESVVAGDLIAVNPGDAFPADCRIVKAENLQVDESALTGESAPATKNAAVLSGVPADPTAASNIGFQGTIVVSGEAEAVVVATAGQTVLGQLAMKTEEVKRPSIFERNIAAFSRFLVWLVVVMLSVVYAANLFIKGSSADPWALLLFSLAVAVSVIPEALPAVMTVTFAKGALALAKKKVIVKRLSAIEDLGQIEILCTDKTGTITENRLAIGRISCGEANACLLGAMHSSVPAPVGKTQAVSSFDSAVWNFASKDLRDRASAVPALAFLPFDPARRRNATIVERDGKTILSLKGAPEDILDLCGVAGEARAKAEEEFLAMGREGMRVLAVAEKEVERKADYGPADEAGATFIGLIGFIDPLKASAKGAIELAEKLNVRIKIITGDSFAVATAIGLQVGIIVSDDGAINGPDLEKLDGPAFNEAVDKYDVFSRVTPELKYKIVSALERKYAVGFLGEGINDAPALKAANVALAVAEASDIAREAADVVLLDRSLAVVIDGIREGRIIFANVNKYIRYTLVGNLGNFFSIALISLFVDYLPLLPVQILLINLLTDIPFISVATDNVDGEDIAGPHRFSIRGLAFYACILGFVASLFDFIFFGIFRHADPARIRSLWFIDNMLTETATIFVLRTNRFFLASRRPSWLLAGLATMVMMISVALPFTQLGTDVFGLTPPPLSGLAIVLGITISYIIATEIAKIFYLKFVRGVGQERS